MGRRILDTAFSQVGVQKVTLCYEAVRQDGSIRVSISILKSSYLHRKINKFRQLKNLKKHPAYPHGVPHGCPATPKSPGQTPAPLS